MGFTVEMDELEYRIVGDGEGQEGETVPYGEVATLKVGDAIYYAHTEDPDATEVPVYRVDNVTLIPSEVVDVQFTDDGDTASTVVDEDDEGDGEDDGEEEEEEEEEETGRTTGRTMRTTRTTGRTTGRRRRVVEQTTKQGT